LRVNFRKNGYFIAENVYNRFHPGSYYVGTEICIFCGSSEKLTREHVFPKWFFEKNTNLGFVSSANRLTQTYNKAVIPCCANCNNSILSEIEKNILNGIRRFDFSNFDQEEFQYNMIRWMEILDYKCQVYDCRRKFLKFPNSDYDPLLGILPVSVMNHFKTCAPFRPFDHLRNTQRRISVMRKTDRLTSLLIFEMSKPNYDFFLQPTQYLYVSIPFRNIAFFYFFKEKFSSRKKALSKAKFIMKKIAET
jgi:hypothetical protein